jgi:CRISPR/Cas system CSM-associated protein Csm3 (group 7 of RAMP superfamily)
MFGNTSIASRIRIEDAYPDNSKAVKTEERNGVAIDRVFGSVPVGPFNYQVCTAGEFKTKLHLKNFTLAQLGLIGLVLRDLNDGWFGLGFAKSRGLGTVKVKLNQAVIQYPDCEFKNGNIHIFGNKKEPWAVNSILGVGEFLDSKEAEKYNFPNSDKQYSESAITESMDLNFGVKLTWLGDDKNGVHDLFTQTVESWKKEI